MLLQFLRMFAMRHLWNVDYTSWHIATSDNERNVHQEPSDAKQNHSPRQSHCVATSFLHVHFFTNVIEAFLVRQPQAKFLLLQIQGLLVEKKRYQVLNSAPIAPKVKR